MENRFGWLEGYIYLQTGTKVTIHTGDYRYREALYLVIDNDNALVAVTPFGIHWSEQHDEIKDAFVGNINKGLTKGLVEVHV